MRVLCDFHHSSLMRSLVMLFEERLGYDLFRPIGMEWYSEGFWAINNNEDTARQFLDVGSQPLDHTAPLNEVRPRENFNDAMKVYDPGHETSHWACTLDYFKRVKFDFVMASIPEHVPLFKELIAKYNPEAKLIIQMGNNWNLQVFDGENILASIKPQPSRANTMFYHQEFDTEVFKPSEVPDSKIIRSYVNVIKEKPDAWRVYKDMKRILEPRGWQVQALGGQCPDGSITGAENTALSMKRSQFILHVKPGGDGYGHVLHNAYALGRPVITRSSDYAGQLGADLLYPGTFIDLDSFDKTEDAIAFIENMSQDQVELMGFLAYERFKEVVDFEKEAKAIGEWLKTL